MGALLPIVISVMDVLEDPSCPYNLVLYKQKAQCSPLPAVKDRNKQERKETTRGINRTA